VAILSTVGDQNRRWIFVLLVCTRTMFAQDSLSQDHAPSWLVPFESADDKLPPWITFNGQFRDRFEQSGHIGFGDRSDNHDLTQLRLEMILKPLPWLTLVGETQDAEAFFSSAIPATPPYQNRWDVRQAYLQIGNSKNGWFDVSIGREVLSFGEERLIGPSDWLNQGRTFDAVRADLHHPGYNVSFFASSVVIARDGVVDHHFPGDNLH
jgi:hypothetical protein